MRPLNGFEMINFFLFSNCLKSITLLQCMIVDEILFLYLKTDVLKLCFLSRPWHAPQIQAEDLEQKI